MASSNPAAIKYGSDGNDAGFSLCTGTSELSGDHGSAVAQQGATVDLGVVLSAKGIRAVGTAYTITTSGATSLTGTVATGALTVTGAISATTTIKSSGATSGIGYATGAGGEVTQATNRATGVTLNTICGTITTHNASLAAEASADFVVTNSAVAITDVVVLSIQSGENGGGTLLSVQDVAAGSFAIRVHNGNVAAGTAETGAILINFAVIKGVVA